MTLNPRNPPKFQFIAQTLDADAGKDMLYCGLSQLPMVNRPQIV
jgi:hypothetical protein